MMHDLLATLPLWIPALGMLVLLGLEILSPNQDSEAPFWVTVAALGATLLKLAGPVTEPDPFHGMLAVDHLARAIQALLVGASLLVVLMAEPYFKALRHPRADVYALLLASLTGMLVVAASRDLLVLFLGIELLSIPLYVLAAYRRLEPSSVESGLKYFLMGAFASGFLVYGIALLYADGGSTRYSVLGNPAGGGSLLHQLGLALLLVGLGFKIAAAPFHSWVPDVYQGAPTPITGFMAAAVKAAGFAALLRLALEVLPASAAVRSSLTFLAALTMLVGNLGALLQVNWKRMLAWSSVAHAGYLLIGVTAAALKPSSQARTGVVFYLCAYALMTLGAFCVLISLLREHGEGSDLRSLQGLARQRPWHAFALTVCMMSLAGIPMTAGFMSKLYLFRIAMDAHLMALSVFLIVGSVFSLYYYLRVVVALYMKPPAAEPALLRSPLLDTVATVCTLGILLLGLYPTPLLRLLS